MRLESGHLIWLFIILFKYQKFYNYVLLFGFFSGSIFLNMGDVHFTFILHVNYISIRLQDLSLRFYLNQGISKVTFVNLTILFKYKIKL